MSRWANKYVIGLTGNIAVGKSVIRQMLQHLGAYTIDADGLAHQAMSPGAPAYKPVVQTFGQFILGPDQRINRALLGSIVFSNPQALAKLEAIIHPVVGQAINTLVARAKQRVIVIEAIKLYEGDLAAAVDSIWVVNAKPETQLKRLITKRNMSEAEAKQRIAAQNPQSEKVAKADVVINNDGNVEETWKQVQSGWQKVRDAVTKGESIDAPSFVTQPTTQSAAASSAEAATGEASASTSGSTAIEVKRGMPGNAEAIAKFISEVTAKEKTRMDIMMAFGQKSYLLAEESSDKLVGLMGWQVENLITCTDEFYLAPGISAEPVIRNLLEAIEEASTALQSEVSFIFLPQGTPNSIVSSFTKNGYETTKITEIKIPAWREAVQEHVSNDTTHQILSKKLREDRVLQPL